MRKIAIQNYLSHTIHVTVVHIPPATVRFVLSRRQIPVPTGTVVARAQVGPQQGIVTDGIDKRANVTFTQKGLGDRIALTRRDLTDDTDEPILECTVHTAPPEREDA